MRKVLLLCAMLLSGIGAWADFEQTYGGSTPWVKEGFVAPVSARSDAWSIGMTQIPVTASAENVTVTFDWNGSASCGLNILGVDLVDPETYEVVASEYKTGKDSSNPRPVYTLADVQAGSYLLRYFVEEDGDRDAFSKTGGTVRVTGASSTFTRPMSGFYRIKGQNSTKPYLAYTLKNGADLQVVETAEEAGIYYVDAIEDQSNKAYLLNYESGKYFYQSTCFTLGDTKEQVVFALEEGATYANVGDMPRYGISIDGVYMFNNNTDGIVHQSGTADAVSERYFIFEPVYQLPLTVGSVGYSTLYSPVVVTLPEGLEAYCVSSSTSSYVSLTKIEGGVVPANTGVILNGDANPYSLGISGCPSEVGDNQLMGTIADAYVQGPAYVLSAPGGEVGLYSAKLTDGQFKNNANKAYLPASAVASDARFLVFNFGDDVETGITETENGNVNAENDEVYDLAGRRVQNAQKGIFIVNGKMVVR